ncbi:MAG TPA: hypothetical protein DDY43_00395, partial [Synechococcales bacterium UBA10510]|nr:hypothetical protein [Synechococcales bacterium UBA10510]
TPFLKVTVLEPDRMAGALHQALTAGSRQSKPGQIQGLPQPNPPSAPCRFWIFPSPIPLSDR